jgi:hypothetical protein
LSRGAGRVIVNYVKSPRFTSPDARVAASPVIALRVDANGSTRETILCKRNIVRNKATTTVAAAAGRAAATVSTHNFPNTSSFRKRKPLVRRY